ncbi:hypothetical protein [Streptomyces jeddahensis]|uniref:Uncharacterized protein n=1 Tax=Streptomyces jeddahensis TaxID=1716141 RepID=A0A177HY92_9ACTN|nr:hypothetical protein [Streptomyces jeddahensis]OAH15264.1 hypothetical protein STSP_13720 [Streptomyces jeddahensis]
MAASANLLLSALSKPTDLEPMDLEPTDLGRTDLSGAVPAPAHALDDCTIFTAEGACSEAPLTSEPPLADAAPLTSEPPLADAAPLTSEPTPIGAAAAPDPMGA